MRMMIPSALLLVAGCTPGSDETGANATHRRAPPTTNEAVQASLQPPEPGEAAGLPDDRPPLPEGPIEDTSAQGAAQVVQSYFALLEQGRHGEAWRLWGNGGGSNGLSEPEFAASFARYREYHAQIGAPGRIEGAAGSLYVEVPVQVYGRLTGGQEFSRSGTVTLRRANDVPGSTPAERRWHIYRSEVDPGYRAPAAPANRTLSTGSHPSLLRDGR